MHTVCVTAGKAFELTVDIGKPAGDVLHVYRCGHMIHEQPKTSLGFFPRMLGLLVRTPALRLPQCAQNRRPKASLVVLQHIVDGALLEGFDSTLFADRARYEYERDVRIFTLTELQRLHAAEARDAVIGKNDIGIELAQSLSHGIQLFDTLGNNANTLLAQFTHD